jgi:WD40 repeat protein
VHGLAEPVRRLRRDNQGRILVVVKSESENTLQVGRSTRIEVWNAEEWQEQNSWRIPGVRLACAVSPDGRWLATGRRFGGFQVWNLTGRCETNSVSVAAGTVTDLAFSPDSRRLATASAGEEAIKLWDVSTWQELITLERKGETLNQLSFSADGHQLTARNLQGNLLFWRVPSLAEIAQRENQQAGAK